MPLCPICAHPEFVSLATPDNVRDECRVREEFVSQRLTSNPDEEELKDLTDFFHGEDAEILECSSCGLLIRRPLGPNPTEEYAKDEYDPSAIEQVYPRYVSSFRKKEHPYRSLLPAAANVLEVGSHYGAFLQVAGEWGWQAEGVDPGKDTVRFAKSKGFRVHPGTLQEGRFQKGQFDAVFIWNCFEQIDDPVPVLKACAHVLRPGGLLTVRTPNGAFYSACRKLLTANGVAAQAKEFVSHAMAYNNLLGFPYLYGHSPETLTRLIQPFGFKRGGVVNSELLVFPLPENPPWVEKEERVVNANIRFLENWMLTGDAGDSIAPWIEVWFRTNEPSQVMPAPSARRV